MLTIIAFIFVFSILVFFHEFGHFIAAKASGVRVYKFAFGFGP
ncbi:MAG: site-2 protease family protein, partial [Candidatus Atribacteria bacterium]|nr:site-2 protease family protein [Candidatus Atribacteria bacterium]